MDGHVSVESEPGRGSTFFVTVKLPRSPQPVRSPIGSGHHLAGRRVLVVDDNEASRKILVQYLGLWGMDVAATASAREAINWVRGGRDFDVALLDFRMPEMDGLSLAAALREPASGHHFPVILLTGLERHDEMPPGLGVEASLTKPIKPSLLYDALSGVFGEREGTRVGPPTAAMPAPSVPLRVLVADDSTVNQRVAATMVERLGHQVDVVSSGVEAVAALQNRSYDVVLMDMYMPEMDGLEATRRIRQILPSERQPRVLAVTASVLEADRIRCREAGMDDFLGKPIRMHDLQQALAAVIPAVGGDLDQPTLDELLAAVGGDRMVLAEMLQEYLRESQRIVDRLQDALQRGDLGEVRLAAHTLKGTSAQFGASHLAALCEQVEHHDAEGWPPLHVLEGEVAEIMAAHRRVSELLAASV